MDEPARSSTTDELLRHAAWIRALARALVADPATADDLVQDAWVAALRRPPAADRPLRPWLARVLVNAARQHARGRGRRERREAEAHEPAPLPGPEELAQKLEAERRLTEQLARLDEPFRSTLMLRYYEGLEPSEIARREGTPPGTVRWRLSRGLELLRARLDERAGGRAAWSALLLPLARLDEAAASAAAAAPAAFTGVLAMSTAWKIGAAAVAVAALAVGLTWSGVLPGPLAPAAAERPAEVRFRPLAPREAPAAAELAPSEPREGARQALAAFSAAPLAAEETSEPAPASMRVVARTVDESGGALAGIVLSCREAVAAGASAESAADGRVELALAVGEREVRVELSAPGFAARGERFVARPGETVYLGTLVMRPGGAVSGRVVAPDGTPVAGAAIGLAEAALAARELESRRLERHVDGVPTCSSARDGSFTLAGVAPGFVRLWAVAEGRLASFSAPLEVRAGEESFGLELVLPELTLANVIRGVVLDPDGAPLAGAELAFRYASASTGTVVSSGRTTPGDGRFEFLLPQDARLSITARDPKGRFGPAAAADVATGEVALELRLSAAGASATLRAVDARGRPVESFGFDVLSPDGSVAHARAGRAPRPDGRAEFTLPAGPFVLRVDAPGHERAESGPHDPAAIGGAGLEIVLAPAPCVRGRVVAGGVPVAGARLRLHQLVGDDEAYERNGFRARLRHDDDDRTESAEDGSFALTARRVGPHVVRAEKDGFAPAESAPLALGGGDVEIVLALGRGGALEGRLVAPPGEDPAGRILGLTRGDGYGITLRTGPGGAYRFERLTPGPWRLAARPDEISPATVVTTWRGRGAVPFDQLEWSCEVHEGETTYFDLVVGAPDACALAGRIALGSPQAGSAHESAGPWVAKLVERKRHFMEEGVEAAVGPDGRFALGVAEPGEYWLVVRSSPEPASEQYVIDVVRLKAGTTPWAVELETGALAVDGVAAWDGADVPALVHMWEGPGELLVFSVLSGDAHGLARVARVPAGEGRIVRPSRENPDVRRWESVLAVDVPAGGEARVRLP